MEDSILNHCVECDSLFQRRNTRSRYCSKTCRQTAGKRRQRASRRQRGVQCQWSTCSKISEGGRYCPVHTKRARDGVDMDAPIRDLVPRIGTICSLPDCSKPLYYRGFCRYHYHVDGVERGLKASANYFSPGHNRHERRAEAYGVDSERVDRLAVFERDGWTCSICGDPVDPECAYPDPFSPSLDHKIPLSRGGGHVESNCQLAHLQCNALKGASLAA